MKIYTLKKSQFIPADINSAWNFFSNPVNLQKITPSYMGFQILNDELPEKMHPGMIIRYFVKPIAGISLLWVTEITHVKDKEYFVDEQRLGPYKFWHHQHKFIPQNGGVLMEDEVNYALPFSAISKYMHRILVQKKIDEIFEYRFKTVENIFKK